MNEKDRVPPQNNEAETSVLGSMLISSDACYSGFELLKEENFYKNSHKLIFSAMAKLFQKNEAIDLVTVMEQLKRDKKIEAAGGAAYLASLAESVPSASNAAYYARIVKEKSILRSMIGMFDKFSSECYDSPEDMGLFVDQVEQSVFSIARDRQSQDFVHIKELIHDSLETAERLMKNKQLVTGTPTGFVDFDEKTSGLHPSDFMVIASRPSMGKTSLALNIAQHAAIKNDVPVALFSLEMSKEQLVQRLLCAEARVNSHQLRTGYLGESAFPRLTMAAGKLNEADIFIDDTPAISGLELRAKARRLKAKENIGMVIVDYLQLMNWAGRADNRQQEISELSRALKSLAREINVPVIALSQLSRAVEARTDKRPVLSDLRESGAIEQDADIVVLLFREEYYDASKGQGEAEIHIAKQRNGPVGSFKLAFIKEYARFENLTTAAAGV
jgi:replicative DNA helicase